MEIWEYGSVKTTIDIPDDLYRQVKAKSAIEGKCVREVAVTLFSRWLHVGDSDNPPEGSKTSGDTSPVPAWFAMAQDYAGKVKSHGLGDIRRSIAGARRRNLSSPEEMA